MADLFDAAAMYDEDYLSFLPRLPASVSSRCMDLPCLALNCPMRLSRS
jgi:hypothetical protein